MPRSYSLDELEDLLRNTTLTTKEIGEKLGITAETVRRVARYELGILMSSRPKREVRKKPFSRVALASLLETSMSLPQIAQYFGVTYEAVRRVAVNEMGVDLKERKRVNKVKKKPCERRDHSALVNDLLTTGVSVRKLAVKHEVADRTVYNVARREGINLKDRRAAFVERRH